MWPHHQRHVSPSPSNHSLPIAPQGVWWDLMTSFPDLFNYIVHVILNSRAWSNPPASTSNGFCDLRTPNTHDLLSHWHVWFPILSFTCLFTRKLYFALPPEQGFRIIYSIKQPIRWEHPAKTCIFGARSATAGFYYLGFSLTFCVEAVWYTFKQQFPLLFVFAIHSHGNGNIPFLAGNRHTAWKHSGESLAQTPALFVRPPEYIKSLLPQHEQKTLRNCRALHHTAQPDTQWYIG